ncbi:MAG: L,D-transpeptidase [Hyphomicrobiales bacterium]|nr:L,D-transpeptidase [Hyphomicrobiales bacterium]
MSVSRRRFLASTLASSLLPAQAFAAREIGPEWIVGVIPDKPFNIDLVNLRMVPEASRRRSVRFISKEAPGTIVIDAAARSLHLVQQGGRALRFGIAVGRDGAAWRGSAVVGRKAKWPTWTPTANMRKRNPKLPVQVKGGPENPLGARALYLYQDGIDTLYRIHGTNEPWSIGKAASSGCIRMLNEDVFELYGSVAVGTRVVVR